MSTALALAEATLHHHSKSFSLAQRLLPSGLRNDAAVVYAWCRRADDAVDEQAPAEAQRALARLFDELDEVYAGAQLDEPLAAAFQAVVLRTRIPKTYPEELLRGMEMDLSERRYRSLSELRLYCYRVAGTVGLMMCSVLGVASASALKHAAQLGMAMQLTNICRDVVEDWRRGRCYLPLDWLPDGAVPESVDLDLATARPFPRALVEPSASAVSRLLDEADRLYTTGEAGARFLSRRCAWAVLTASSVYAAIGALLRARQHSVLGGRVHVPWWRKLALALQAGLRVATSSTSLERGARPTLPSVRFEDVVSG